MTMPRPAVFLDRDGTINVERSYLTKPEDMQLLPFTGRALQLLRAAGFACVVVTNQSAVGRGLMTDADLARVHDEMNRQLAAAGAILDGVYACTIAPTQDDELAVEHPERKPGPGLLLRAAAELSLDLKKSWMIGDSLRDILAGQNAGCLGCILVGARAATTVSEFARAKPFLRADNLLEAANHILQASAAEV